MNFGEMRTTVFSYLPDEWQEKISVFEFGEAIDDAQRLFTIVLPASVIPELVREMFIDRRDDEGATDILPLPEDYLKVENVKFAQIRDDDDEPIRRQARIVEPSEYERLKAAGSPEFIASVFNNLLHVSPDPAPAVTARPSAVRMLYRKRPRPYTTTAGVLQQAARVDLQQDIDSRHTFKAFDYSPAPEKREWGYWELDVNELPGGFVYMGGDIMTADKKAPLYIMRIVHAWDEDGGGFIRVSGDDEVPIADDPAFPGVLGYTYPYSYIAQRPIFGYSGASVEAEDHEFPDIGANWHHLICSYAIAKLEERFNVEASKARMARVFQTLTGSGAKLDYTKE